MSAPNMSCGPSVLAQLSSHVFRERAPAGRDAGARPSFRTERADEGCDEYSAEFSPESFTKRVYGAAGTATESPLLPATACMPHRPLDANKGYPLPTNCFPEIDWVAEYNAAGAAYSTILVPPEPVALDVPVAAAPAHARPRQNQPVSVKNSLVQTDVDGDDSMFWYKSTTRFACPEDDWDYERLRQRIREYTSAPSTETALGPAADVNETVRQTTVRRLKALLAQLTNEAAGDDAEGVQPKHGNILDGGSVDVARLRLAIAELSRPPLKLVEM